MELNQALTIAESLKSELAPHCERIEIAGSIRRKKPEVKDIEIVCIPKPYETGLFATGIATVVNQWPKVKGDLPCKYTQRIVRWESPLQGGVPSNDGTGGVSSGVIKLDLFFATPDNWGLIYAIRTGSADFSHKVLAATWSRQGYKSEDGHLTSRGHRIAVREEEDVFNRLGIPFVKPEDRI